MDFLSEIYQVLGTIGNNLYNFNDFKQYNNFTSLESQEYFIFIFFINNR